ncbi:LamG-like jellyroll fold domain-containing protein [Rubripirellula lacrimiformis]|uniref:LamG-like jellyroll fold domain-containing protein n=1 Tax=Rubripirellula lacrimiformis TaxID=1930273 RepID=UPI001FE5519C|nr:LamG-like jellyroll fold domain-containing protein [Rubripirellula lacrimiformis]
MKSESDREFAKLLDLAVNGQIDHVGLARAEQLMQEDRQRMECWVDHFRLDSMLSDEMDRRSIVDLVDLVAASNEADSPETGTLAAWLASHLSGRTMPWIAATALAAVLLLMLAPRFWTPSNSVVSQLPHRTDSSGAIAMLVQSTADRWKGRTQSPAMLSPGRLQLESGLAEIEIYNGVTMYLEGPVDLDLISLDRVHLHHGKIRAVVPEQALGFTVTTESVQLVDRGTEFAISAEYQGLSKVHVFDGLVDLYPIDQPDVDDDKPGHPVHQGQSVEVGPAFATRETELDPDEFPSASAIDRSVEQRRQRWVQWSQQFAKRSDLVLYFTFENPRDHKPHRQRVDNLASPPQEPSQGTIVGGESMAGRWPGKNAIGFYHSADRVRVRVPGDFPQLTLACWARVDELRGANQALLLTDTFEPWQPHWQIAREGVLKLGIGQPTPQEARAMRSPSQPLNSVTPIGRWMHLATVYDSETKSVQHYINGDHAGSNQLPSAKPLRIGTAEIGNWLKPRTEGGEPVRNLDGRIDEFMLLRSALDAKAIREMYEAGR